MNNEQFRRLLLQNQSSPKKQVQVPADSHSQSGDGATPRALLGSRMRSSIPMTPRSVTGVDFARQLAEHRRETSGQPPSKKFKSSAAPKGTKLPSGYQDRAQLRQSQDERGSVEDVETRIKALEEMVKLGQVDRATFEKLRSELGVGGDVKSTHMVKGLDWELLRRVKAGEDVEKQPERKVAKEEDSTGDVDEELDRVLEEKVVSSAPKEKEKKKKGIMAPPPPSIPRSRDEILQQLKASRAAAANPPPDPQTAESRLGSKFKRIGETKPEKKRWVEHDENGRRREVLLITDAEGNTKRKVRWLDKPGESNGKPVGLLVPDKDATPLGMEVPAVIAAKAAAAAPRDEDEDDDIFAGVGADYNPLADIGDDDDDSSDDDEDAESGEIRAAKADKASVSELDQKEPERTAEASKPRNYFGTSTTVEAEAEDRSNPLTKDPTILAALKRAAALRQAEGEADDEEDEEGVDSETLLRRRKFIEEARRREALDAMDLDLGFGSSRIEDEEDEEGITYEKRGGQKRKRGPKKRKGDKDSASDVLRVLEGRKKAD